jgi:hypothetical protein
MKNYKDQFGVEIQLNYPTKKKLVKSGCLVEIYQFGNDILLGRKRHKVRTPEEEALRHITPPNHEEALKSSARRAKRMIKRLIYSNSFKWLKDKGKPYLPITLTLTFEENIQDLKQANYEFTKFIRRLNYETNGIEGKELKQSNIKYLAVFELQKRGAIHYHAIFFNMPYINNIYDRMRDIWGQGRIMVGGKEKNFNKIKNQTQLKKIIDYFIKYIQKSIFENSFPNQKKYITSKGLIKPMENYFEEVIDLVESEMPSECLVYKRDGETEYNNSDINDTVGQPKNYLRWLNYYQYDLSNNPEIESRINEILETYS